MRDARERVIESFRDIAFRAVWGRGARTLAIGLFAVTPARDLLLGEVARADTPHLATASMERFSSARSIGGMEARPGPTKNLVKIGVRLIRASSPLTNAELIQGAPKLSLDARLRDLQGHLSRLRYRDFTLLSSQERLTELMKRDAVALGGGYELTVRPMYVEDGRIGMWIRWQDPKGHPVLDTRLHFRCGQTVVAGMDGEGEPQAAAGESSQEEALILAIDAHRAER